MQDKMEQTNIASKFVERNLIMPNNNDSQQEYYNQVSIIKGLSTENDLAKIELRLRGYTYSHFTQKWVQIRKPVMNDLGLGNFMSVLQALGDLANFSNYEEKEIPKLVVLFVKKNYPFYTVYHEDFELDSKDYNIIFTTLYAYSLSVYKNAKNAGHRNVVRGTLSEQVLQRALGGEQPKEKKKGLFSFLRRNKEEK